LSILRVTEVVALLFALSVTEPLMTWPAASAEIVCALGHEVIAAPPGTHANVTVTFVLFHPAALGVGNTDAVIVGGPAPVTVTPDKKVNPLREAVIVAVPALTPLANPPELIVVMPVLDEPHVTVAVISRLLPSE
jgi:hypothetical protein